MTISRSQRVGIAKFTLRMEENVTFLLTECPSATGRVLATSATLRNQYARKCRFPSCQTLYSILRSVFSTDHSSFFLVSRGARRSLCLPVARASKPEQHKEGSYAEANGWSRLLSFSIHDQILLRVGLGRPTYTRVPAPPGEPKRRRRFALPAHSKFICTEKSAL